MKVEDARSAMQSAKSHNNVLDALMTLKRNGRIPGIFGRLVSCTHVVQHCLASPPGIPEVLLSVHHEPSLRIMR